MFGEDLSETGSCPRIPRVLLYDESLYCCLCWSVTCVFALLHLILAQNGVSSSGVSWRIVLEIRDEWGRCSWSRNWMCRMDEVWFRSMIQSLVLSQGNAVCEICVSWRIIYAVYIKYRIQFFSVDSVLKWLEIHQFLASGCVVGLEERSEEINPQHVLWVCSDLFLLKHKVNTVIVDYLSCEECLNSLWSDSSFSH